MDSVDKLLGIDPKKTFNGLEGAWAIKRHLSCGTKAVGTASFVIQQQNILRYNESGTVTLTNGKTNKFSQEYLYEYNNDTICVHLENNYYELKFIAATIANADYKCNEDHYDTKYYFLEENSFNIACDVSGPKKDYWILTTYKLNQNYK